MSGSGNDFVFFDEADGPTDRLRDEAAIQNLCARGTGVGADGIVILDRSNGSNPKIDYYNSDGSVGELCGNATLCTVRLNQQLGGAPGEMVIRTDSGDVKGRLVDGLPEIDLAPVTKVEPSWDQIEREGSEARLGFALVGVPHVAIEVSDVEAADVLGRGSRVRRDRSLEKGANVNFLAPAGSNGAWTIRTYERGVEGETLACGTGAVASGILLVLWNRAKSPVKLRTRSGRELVVTVREEQGIWYPSLRGPADLVFVGELPT
ncbi:MAG TPA: diaminopimelate epimerase [Gemmatimonadaceae bacterium]|nr:diaminopimelate epimerase [Gemmatimonadaceae bacterium]